MASDPGQGSFDDRAFGQDDEVMSLTALDDLKHPASGVSHRGCGLGALISGIGEDALDEREEAPRVCIEDQSRAVAILQIGGMDNNVQQEAERVNQDVPLAAGDLFARIKALRVKRAVPFCAALALWLSMIAALGLASRPSRSRVAT